MPSASEQPALQRLVPDGYIGRFRTNAGVLQDKQGGPRLCYSFLNSDPPQCEGAAIPNWLEVTDNWNASINPIVTVLYTGALAAHEAEIRRLWGGALCVAQARHTLEDLQRLEPQVQCVSSGIPDTPMRIVCHRYVAAKTDQEELDALYGTGVVELVGYFTPIDLS